MNEATPMQTIKSTIRTALFLLDRYYRHSRLRNAILAIGSQKRAERFISDRKRFAIFLVPGLNTVNGGIMSICSIASETQKLLAMNGVSVAVCTAYGEPRMLRYTKFENDSDIFAFADLLPRFPGGSEVLVHVPDLFVQKFVSDCPFVYRSRPDLTWQFNVLLQNIDLIPPKTAVETLQKIGATTATVAHKAYDTSETARQLGCPVHYLSWRACAEDFECVGYSSKEKLIAISPDPHSAKLEIVRRISATLPDHKIIEIRDMTYKKYKNTIKRAKFAFTFGEGLDGYFVKSIFSGGVAMAIYNERFFTAEYRNLEGVFPDSEHAIADVAYFLKATNNETQHKTIANRQHNLMAQTFVREEYLQNIKTFYEKYCPEWQNPPSQ